MTHVTCTVFRWRRDKNTCVERGRLSWRANDVERRCDALDATASIMLLIRRDVISFEMMLLHDGKAASFSARRGRDAGELIIAVRLWRMMFDIPAHGRFHISLARWPGFSPHCRPIFQTTKRAFQPSRRIYLPRRLMTGARLRRRMRLMRPACRRVQSAALIVRLGKQNER